MATEPENVDALFCKAVVSAKLGEHFDALKVQLNHTARWSTRNASSQINSLMLEQSNQPHTQRLSGKIMLQPVESRLTRGSTYAVFRLGTECTSLNLCDRTLHLSQTTGVQVAHPDFFCSFLTREVVSTSPTPDQFVDRTFLRLSLSTTRRRLVAEAPPKLTRKGATTTKPEMVGCAQMYRPCLRERSIEIHLPPDVISVFPTSTPRRRSTAVRTTRDIRGGRGCSIRPGAC